MKCPVCDAGALNGARFCSRCGASMTATPADRPRGDLGSSMAKGAMIGAVVAIPVPFIGPIAGAVVGAGVAAYKTLSKD